MNRESIMKGIFEKKWARVLLISASCIAIVYALIYVDVVLRARSAYMQGEKYFSWYEDPKLKERSLQADFQKEKSKLDENLAGGKVTQDEYKKQLEIASFNYERKREESSIKYAYIWYQTVIELFSPPESKWVKLARENMPKAKELWKQELRAKNIPFEDYMLD